MTDRFPLVLDGSGNVVDFAGDNLIINGNVLPSSGGVFSLGASGFDWNLFVGDATGSVYYSDGQYLTTLTPGVSGQVLTTRGAGLSPNWENQTGSGGTVTNFSAGNLTPLFTTSVSTSTTTPALSFTLTNAAAHKFLGNNTGSTGAPDYVSITTADLPSNVAYTDAGNSFTVSQVPNTFATLDLGSTTKPWRDIYTGPNAGSNYQKITSTSLSGNRTFTLVDANSNSIRGLSSGTTSNWVTYVGTDGVQNVAQPAFSDILGTATSGQLPATVAYTNSNNSFTVAQLPNTFATLDLGSTTKPWRDIYVGPNAGSNYTKVTNATLTGNRTFTLVDSDSNSAVPRAAVASNWLRSFLVDGTFTASQPAFSDVSGTIAIGQLPTNIAFVNSWNSFTVDQLPNAAGTLNLGASSVPWGSVFIGNAATNNNKLVSSNCTAARTCTLPDANSNTVRPLGSQTTNQWVAYIGADGLQNTVQINFNNLAGSATIGQLPTITEAKGGTNADLSAVTQGSVFYQGSSSTFTSLTPSATALIGFTSAGTAIEAVNLTSTGGTISFTRSAGGLNLEATGGSGTSKWTVSNQTSNFTSGTTTFTYYRCTSSLPGVDQFVTLPTSPADGTLIMFKNLGTGQLTFVPDAINGIALEGAYSSISLGPTAGTFYPVITMVAVTGGWEVY